MGLLDDAIREHLELKRRRGGDPAEIERAERDALGPVRREPEPIAPTGYDEAEPAGAEFDAPLYEDEPAALPDEGYAAPTALEPEPDLSAYPDPAPPPPGFEAPSSYHEPSGYDEPAPGSIPDEPASPMPHGVVGTGPDVTPASEPGELHDEPDPWLSEPAQTAPEPPSSDPLNQETVEYRLAPEHDAEDGEDVLEETPEFLQDAPEHDRLWFEQRPPRDFDFDK